MNDDYDDDGDDQDDDYDDDDCSRALTALGVSSVEEQLSTRGRSAFYFQTAKHYHFHRRFHNHR